MGHSCRTLLWDTPVGHSCGTLLRDTVAGHSCETLLQDTVAGHSCGTLLWDTHLGHSCGTLLWDPLAGHSCGTLLWDTLVGHSCDTRVGHTLRTRLPPKVTRQVSKTSVLYETSSKSHTPSLQNERFVRDFLQKSHVKSPKRAFHTRLPPKVTCQVPKTSVSYETSSNSHVKEHTRHAALL